MTKASEIADARVVVIGGGIGGCSAAYHLAALGMPDVLLLERSRLSSGTTWHSTGNMETYRDDPLIFSMVRYAVESFPLLQAESHQEIGWRNVGRVMYTDRDERLEHFKTLPELGRARGIEMQLLTPADVARRLAIIDPDGLVGGLWVPSDGRVNPTDIVMAYAKAARARGVQVHENTEVLEVTVRNGRVCGVMTNQGAIACDNVVIAAGLWSSSVASSCGVQLPLYALEHQYIITQPIVGLDREMPLFLSYDDQLYGREEVGGLMVGSLDDHALPISTAELPSSFSFGLLPERWAQFEPYMLTAMRRFPILRSADIKMQMNGPESFTPDGQMLLGPVPGVSGVYSACGFNSNGIALAPAAGKFIAEWIIDGRPSADVDLLDVRRFTSTQCTEAFMRERVTEIPGYSCRMHSPGDDYETARGICRSPIHAELIDAGAHFVSVAAWERPLWIAASAKKQAWIDAVAAEVCAAADNVLLVDRSADTKIALLGADAQAWVKARVAVRQLGAEVRARLAVFPGMRGAIEAVGRILPWEGGWLLTVGPEQETRLKEWLRRSALPSAIRAQELTNGWALFELAGPKRQALLTALLSKANIAPPPFDAWAGAVQTRVVDDPMQVSTLLLAPAHGAAYVWRRMLQVGGSVGLRIGGHYAQEALRVARGIPRFGAEATPGTEITQVFGTAFGTTWSAPAHRDGRSTPAVGRRELAVFSSPSGLPGFGAREAVVQGDRTVGEVTSRVWLPGWRETLLLALLSVESLSSTSLEMVAQGRRWPLTARSSNWLIDA
jgi:glycine/D-amino acid oxidase-like deaminating enzyme/glycine cleavage system aminomethyltransferase T